MVARNSCRALRSGLIRWTGIALVVLAFLTIPIVPYPVEAQAPDTRFILHGDRADYVTFGQTIRRDCDFGFRVATYDADRNGIPEAVTIVYGDWVLTLHGGTSGRDLTAGVYENASYPQSLEDGTPGLFFAGDGRSCSDTFGRFEILEAVYDTEHTDASGNPTVESFAVRFRQSCIDTPRGPALLCLMTLKSTVPLDLTPPFVSDVAVSRTRLSRSRGDSMTISWKSADNSGVQRVEILWASNGTQFESLAQGIDAATTSFTWTPPTTTLLTTQGVVKIVAVDENGNAGEARYAGAITIKR